MMQIRKYQPGEQGELWDLFFHTIRNVNLQHYTPEQVRAWVPDGIDEEKQAYGPPGLRHVGFAIDPALTDRSMNYRPSRA